LLERFSCCGLTRWRFLNNEWERYEQVNRLFGERSAAASGKP
jgi:hypothetical protein